MPRKPCYWTRKLELQLVEFVRERDFIWKPLGNTNHQIQQKYKAYAEFAAKLGRGFTARSVRDRWVNIRSTFNHNLRRVDKSKEVARSPAEVYVPCWPLWRPLQFLREVSKKEESNNYEVYSSIHHRLHEPESNIKEELQSEAEEIQLGIRQRGRRTDRPRRRLKIPTKKIKKGNKCIRLLNDLVNAMKPISTVDSSVNDDAQFWFFGRHVTARLNAMREIDALCASRDILEFLDSIHTNGMSIKTEEGNF